MNFIIKHKASFCGQNLSEHVIAIVNYPEKTSTWFVCFDNFLRASSRLCLILIF